MRFDFNDTYHPESTYRRMRQEDDLHNEPVMDDYSIPRPEGYWAQYDELLLNLRINQPMGLVSVVMLQNGKFSVTLFTHQGRQYTEPFADRLEALRSATAQWGG
jgi:hypothetical protein